MRTTSTFATRSAPDARTLVTLGGLNTTTLPLDGFDCWAVITKGATAQRQSSAHNVSKHGVYAGVFRLGQHTLILLGASSSSFVGSESIVLYTMQFAAPPTRVCVIDMPCY